MTRAVFRFAPSPTGHLHLGHAYSALLNLEAARKTGGRFLLRFEDTDATRCTPELTAALLEDLAWLGIASDEPVRVQSQHTDEYRAALAKLEARGLIYRCGCSRRDIARKAGPERDPEGQPLYPGTCRAGGPGPEPHALRLDMARATAMVGDLRWEEDGEDPVKAEPLRWGDIVLGRKETGTSYHLAVVLDDALQGVTDVIRGRDLYHATSIHRLLQELLGLPAPRYRHHRLITDETGKRLAKSAGSRSLRSLRAEGVTAEAIRETLGFGRLAESNWPLTQGFRFDRDEAHER
jgi:glutamyl-Q tRNA(Asp) synthetase